MGAVELLDLIARKGSKITKPMINDLRPDAVKRAGKKREVQSMSDPKVREFFGAGQIHYTPKRDPSEPPDGSEGASGSTSTPETEPEPGEASESLGSESSSSSGSSP